MKPPICNICSKDFTFSDVGRSSSTPLLLQCAHNICCGCAFNVSTESGFVQCPSCLQKTDFTDEGLPVDHYLLGFLLVKSAAGEGKLAPGLKVPTGLSESGVCDECNKEQAVLFCDKCQGSRFCQSCFSLVHGSSKLLSRHVPSNLTESASAKLYSCYRQLHGQLQLRMIQQLEQYQTTAPSQLEAVMRELDSEITHLSQTTEITQQNDFSAASTHSPSPSVATTPSNADKSSVSLSTIDQPSALHQLLYSSPLFNTQSGFEPPTAVHADSRSASSVLDGSAVAGGGCSVPLLGLAPAVSSVAAASAASAGFYADKRLAANLRGLSMAGERHLAGKFDNSDICSQTGSQCSTVGRNSACSSPGGRLKKTLTTKNVVVTHLSTPSCFFVRQQSVNQQLVSLHWRVQQSAAAAAPYHQQQLSTTLSQSVPSKGQLCLARYSGDKSWCRARVLGVHHPPSSQRLSRPAAKAAVKLDVIFIDFGNVETVPLTQARVIPADLVNLAPPLAISCSLADIEPCAGSGSRWPQKTIDEMARLVRNGVFEMTTLEIRADGTHLVDLLTCANPHIRQDEPVSIQQHLVMLQLARQTSTQKLLLSTETKPISHTRRYPANISHASETASIATPSLSPTLSLSLPTTACNSDANNSNNNKKTTNGSSGTSDQYQRRDVINNNNSSRNSSLQPVSQSLIDRRTFYPPQTLRCGSRLTVMISNVESPARFCIQQLGVHSMCMTSMMDEIQQMYSSVGAGSYDLLNPRVGQVCVARYSLDNKYYRAIIEQVCDRDKVHVLYVDYGNREQVPLDRIKKIVDQFTKIAQQAVWCSLADVVPLNSKTGWAAAATQYFSRFADRQLKMYVDDVSGSSNTVTLYLSEGSTSMCINALLVRNGFAVGVGPSTRSAELTKNSVSAPVGVFDVPVSGEGRGTPPTQSRSPAPQSKSASRGGRGRIPGGGVDGREKSGLCREMESSQFDLPTHGESGTSVTVSHFVSPTDFWVRKTSEANDLKALMQLLQSEYGAASCITTEPLNNWICGDMAVASCTPSRCFYRLKLLQLLDNERVKALLIDSGEVIELGLQQLKSVRQQFVEPRPFATHCRLEDIRPAGDNSAKWTGFACDFTRQMIDKSYRLFLIQKSADITETSECLPCDLEVEEEMTVGALEPARVIRTSLAMKLINEGLAFRGSMIPATNMTATAPISTCVAPSCSVNSASACSVTSHDDITEHEDSSSTEVNSSPDSVSKPLPSILTTNDAAADINPAQPESWEVEDGVPVCEGESGHDSDDDLPMGSDWASLSRVSAMAPVSDVEEHDQQVRDDEQAAAVVAEKSSKMATGERVPRAWLPAVLPEAGDSFEAIATHVSMSCVIYLYAKRAGEEALKAISSMLQTQLQNSEPRPCDTENWSLGEPCFAKYYLDRQWYRAQVVKKHENNKLTVLFVDYGNTDKVDSVDLRRNIFADDIPIQALSCQLYNIVPLSESGQFPVKTLDWIHKQVVDKDCRIIVHCVNEKKRRLMVSLQLLCSGLDIGHLLVQMGAARRMSVDELSDSLAAISSGADDGGERGLAAAIVDVLLHGPINQLQLPVRNSRKPVPVICSGVITPELLLLQPQQYQLADSSDSERCQLAMHVKQLAELPDRLATLAEHQLPVQPPLPRGGLCLAHSREDDLWYRAVALEEDLGSCLVLLIDYGLQESLPYSRLRELPQCMRVVPAWIILVQLHGIQPADPELGWTDDTLSAVKTCLFSDKHQLYVLSKTEASPPQVELVVRTSPSAKPRLAYQTLVDQGHFRLKGRAEVTFTSDLTSDGSSVVHKPHSD